MLSKRKAPPVSLNAHSLCGKKNKKAQNCQLVRHSAEQELTFPSNPGSAAVDSGVTTGVAVVSEALPLPAICGNHRNSALQANTGVATPVPSTGQQTRGQYHRAQEAAQRAGVPLEGTTTELEGPTVASSPDGILETAAVSTSVGLNLHSKPLATDSSDAVQMSGSVAHNLCVSSKKTNSRHTANAPVLYHFPDDNNAPSNKQSSAHMASTEQAILPEHHPATPSNHTNVGPVVSVDAQDDEHSASSVNQLPASPVSLSLPVSLNLSPVTAKIFDDIDHMSDGTYFNDSPNQQSHLHDGHKSGKRGDSEDQDDESDVGHTSNNDHKMEDGCVSDEEEDEGADADGKEAGEDNKSKGCESDQDEEADEGDMAESPLWGRPIDSELKYAPCKVNYGLHIPSSHDGSDKDSDSDKEIFDSATFKQLFGPASAVTNNIKSAFKSQGEYNDDNPLSIWLVDDDVDAPCDYKFKTSQLGEVCYYSTFPRQDISGVVEIFTQYRLSGMQMWFDVPPGHAVPCHSVHQHAWAQHDFDAMATAAGWTGDEPELCDSSDYRPSEDDESDSKQSTGIKSSKRPRPCNMKGKQHATRPRSRSPVHRAGRPTRVEIEQCESLGKETFERVEELAHRFGRDKQTILVTAGLYFKAVCLQTYWNAWQMLWRIKNPEIVSQDKDWRCRCSAKYNAFMDAVNDDPDLQKARGEEILCELETMSKDPVLVLNPVTQMNAVLSDSNKQCKTERFLQDIHVLKFVIYTGSNTKAAGKSGVVTGSPLILEMIKKGNCRIQELINLLTGLIQGYQATKEVDLVLNTDISLSPLKAVPVVLPKSKSTRKGKAKELPPGFDSEEEWLMRNDFNLQLYREGVQESTLGLNCNSNKILICSTIANHFAKEFNFLQPFNVDRRGNFPWHNFGQHAITYQLSMQNWPFSFWLSKADSLSVSQYHQLADMYIRKFESAPRLVWWTKEQKALDPMSFAYRNIPLVISDLKEPVLKLYYRNASYLKAYQAVHPNGRDHYLHIDSSPCRQEFEGHLIVDDEDNGSPIDDGIPRLHTIPKILELPTDDIDEFPDEASKPSNANSTSSRHPAPQTCLPASCGNLFHMPPAANANTLNFAPPACTPQPCGDVASVCPRDGVERMVQMRRQPRTVATPVNPNIFYEQRDVVNTGSRTDSHMVLNPSQNQSDTRHISSSHQIRQASQHGTHSIYNSQPAFAAPSRSNLSDNASESPSPLKMYLSSVGQNGSRATRATFSCDGHSVAEFSCTAYSDANIRSSSDTRAPLPMSTVITSAHQGHHHHTTPTDVVHRQGDVTPYPSQAVAYAPPLRAVQSTNAVAGPSCPRQSTNAHAGPSHICFNQSCQPTELTDPFTDIYADSD